MDEEDWIALRNDFWIRSCSVFEIDDFSECAVNVAFCLESDIIVTYRWVGSVIGLYCCVLDSSNIEWLIVARWHQQWTWILKKKIFWWRWRFVAAIQKGGRWSSSSLLLFWKKQPFLLLLKYSYYFTAQQCKGETLPCKVSQ